MKNKTIEKKNTYVVPMRILAVLLLVVLLMNGSSHIFAQINQGYSTETIDVKETTDWIKSSVLAQPIGSLLLWVGGIVEWALGRISVVVSGGDAIMPWADAILFNAVPILDVNFINPADGSIVKALSGIIQGMYYTVLGLAIAFFSIVVMIMAIKLAVSAIASEKAKYKSALVSWATALVLLFTLHYFISFVFFLNESLVKVAANMVEEEIGESSFTLNNVNKEEAIEEAVNHIRDKYKNHLDAEKIQNMDKIMEESPDYFLTMSELSQDDQHSFFGHSGAVGKINEWTDSEWRTNVDLVSRWIDFYITVAKLPTSFRDGLKNTGSVGGSDSKTKYSWRDQYLEWIFSGYAGYLYDHPGHDTDVTILADDKDQSKFSQYCPGKNKQEWLDRIQKYMKKENTNGMGGTASKQGYSSEEMGRLANIVLQVNSVYGKSGSGGYEDAGKEVLANNNKMPITMMAQYFRKNSYMPSSEKSLVAEDIYLPNCIMYLIFVIQSMLYFFSYMKRLFYVVVLALLGPVIIVFDFFMKV